MSVSSNLLDTIDLDWFAVDQNGNLAHFASGGSGFVPNDIKSSLTDVGLFADYVFDLNETSDTILISENIPNFDSSEKADRYVETFLRMAAKGFYSYDVLELTGHDKGYSLIAKPKSPVVIDDIPNQFASGRGISSLIHKVFDKKLLPSDWDGYLA